jgi:hypothetical protein
MRSIIDAFAFLVLLTGLSLLLHGCSADPIADQARAATVTAGVLSAGGEAVTAARGAALDRVEAAHPTDPDHDAALEAEAAKWRPVGIALDEARTALATWIDALSVAHLAGDGASGELLRPVVALAARAVQLLAHAFELATALGVEHVPHLPALLTTLAAIPGGR